jgi:hypothetical protein
MTTLKQIKEINTLEELESLGMSVFYDISHRGGGVGFYGGELSEHFKINPSLLPNKFGAYCNYLGGGIRGSITQSDFSDTVQGRKRALLEALSEACVRVYNDIENDMGMNETEDDDGEIVWDALATKQAM